MPLPPLTTVTICADLTSIPHTLLSVASDWTDIPHKIGPPSQETWRLFHCGLERGHAMSIQNTWHHYASTSKRMEAILEIGYVIVLTISKIKMSCYGWHKFRLEQNSYIMPNFTLKSLDLTFYVNTQHHLFTA